MPRQEQINQIKQEIERVGIDNFEVIDGFNSNEKKKVSKATKKFAKGLLEIYLDLPDMQGIFANHGVEGIVKWCLRMGADLEEAKLKKWERFHAQDILFFHVGDRQVFNLETHKQIDAVLALGKKCYGKAKSQANPEKHAPPVQEEPAQPAADPAINFGG